ncbi:MAG TPA: nucleoside hydrolase [Burkholderiaceae bacterium]|jgi:inosine-uridine nucleoside N-ribohydrolase|nr:nucleoside hydrolase [Burkholderiaceae bacterium]
MTRLLIDCDPGHDDAMAILYAARHLNLVAITTVFGNTSLENATRNALGICTLAGIDVPVAAGMSEPLVAARSSAADIHGKSGLDGAVLPAATRAPDARHAVQVIIDEARAHPGQLTLAPIGPLTNIAVALKTEPRLAGWLKGITLMGGSTTVGNITAMAEFNVYCDPEAAAVVFASGVPIHMAGLNVTRQAGIGPEHVARLQATGGPVGRCFAGLLGFYLARTREIFGLTHASMHDPCALLPLVRPELITHQHAHVHIELASPQLRGMTACDLRRVNAGAARTVHHNAAPNAHVAVAIEGAAAVDDVIRTLIEYDRGR